MVYNQVLDEVIKAVGTAAYLTLTIDGWSRTQGGQHVTNFMACGFRFSAFMDMRVAGKEKASAGAGMDVAGCVRLAFMLN